MKTTMNIPADLLKEAIEASQAQTQTMAVVMGLQELIEKAPQRVKIPPRIEIVKLDTWTPEVTVPLNGGRRLPLDQYFAKPDGPIPNSGRIRQLIEDGVVAIVQPIRAELKSGIIKSSKLAQFDRVIGSLENADPDWNSELTWAMVAKLAETCRKARIPTPGLVDRMILAACESSGNRLWTLDLKLEKLAKHLGLAK